MAAVFPGSIQQDTAAKEVEQERLKPMQLAHAVLVDGEGKEAAAAAVGY